jgi:uncharacterized Zn finger protein (UPF0148 family)
MNCTKCRRLIHSFVWLWRDGRLYCPKCATRTRAYRDDPPKRHAKRRIR